MPSAAAQHSLKSIPQATDGDIDKLLTDYPLAPLLGFATRARLGHLLGVLEKQTSASLRKFAKLRNLYAHRDDAPALTEAMITPILDTRSADYQKHLRGAISAFQSLQDCLKNTNYTPGRMALMVATMMLGMELKWMRQNVVTQAAQALEAPEKLPGQQ